LIEGEVMSSNPFLSRKGTPTKAAVALVVAAAAAIIVPAAAHAASRHAASRHATKPVLAEGVGMRAQPSVRVRELQRALVRRGYSVGASGADGRFGPRTRAAVRRAQHRHHLKVDGVVGPRTRAALRLGARSARAAGQHRRASTTKQRARSLRPATSVATAPTPAASAPAPTPAASTPAPTPTATTPAPVPLSTSSSTSPFLILGPLVVLITALFAFVHMRQRRRHAARIAAYQLGTYIPPSLRQAGQEEPVAEATEQQPPVAVPEPPLSSRSGFGNGARVIGYVTDQSAAAGRAPELDIERACQRSGWQLAEIVRDRDNGSILERPGMSRALERITKGDAQGLVISDGRLLSRSADFARFVRWFRDAEATLIALDLGLDTSTPEGRRLAGALITLNGWAGDWIASRPLRNAAAVAPKEEEPPRLPMSERAGVFARIARMRDDDIAPQEIADQLNREGVPTLFGTEKWRPSTIQTALRYWRSGSATNVEELPSNERRARA
jgi:peptidoglycan hydrolase-like protein with peptidoglycan-binding domain/DNA invertase Pin-like site-specific DNA recombinase